MKKTYQEPELKVVSVTTVGKIADATGMKYNSDTHVDKNKEALGNERQKDEEWGNLW